MSEHLTNALTLENAKLFEQEAITPYEKVLARNLVATMQREANVRHALEEVMSWIKNWSPSFTEDEEWEETDMKVRRALKEQSSE